MPADTWQPPQTGDRQLDRSFLDLADRLAGIDALLSSVAIPEVRITSKNVVLIDESYCEIRGSVAVVVTLPPAEFRGTGRGAMLTIQNFSSQDAAVIVQAGDVLNDGSIFTIKANTGALFSGNGVSRWTGIKPGGGHIIASDGTPLADRPTLNFSSAFDVTDNPGDSSTDVDVTIPPSPAMLHGSYISGAWYAPGHPNMNSTGSLLYGTPTANILWAIPHLFSVAGTITDIATYTAGNGGTSTDVRVAIYRSNAARTAPGVRIYDSGVIAVANFTHTKTEKNAINLSVSADEIIWFACVTKGPQCLGVLPVGMHPLLGTNFDGTGGAAPLKAYVVGYRAAFTFAQPPDPWTSTTKLLATADTGTAAATCVFKFTPS